MQQIIVRKTWIKLHEAGDAQTAAIMKFQTDRNNGLQPNYYPEAENHNGQICRIIQNEGEIQSKAQGRIQSKIKTIMFYIKILFVVQIINKLKKKKENILNQSKTKKQIQKQEYKQKYKKQLKQQQIQKYFALQNQQINKYLSMLIKKRKRKGKQKNIPVIDIQKTRKRKFAKKTQHIKFERIKMIQIYDGSDSELKMM